MSKVVSISSGSTIRRPQVVELPLIPVMDLVMDLFFDGASIPEIACKSRISASKVIEVIRAQSQIHHRQSVIGLLEAGPWVREEYRRIERQVIAETAGRAA